MVLYNVTVSIDTSAESEWLEWMRSIHIPAVMDTNCFIESRLLRVHGEEEGGITYAISYVAPNQESYDEYQEKFAPALQKEHTSKFNGLFVAFRTVLTVIDEFKR